MFFVRTNSIHAASLCTKDRDDYFCLSVEAYPQSQITEELFYLIPIKIYGLYQIQLTTLPYPFLFDFNWKSPFFGAGISHFENQYKLMILGGTTRIEEFSPDAYAALVCHEVGHLIGGEPFQTIPGADWASSEGQADFFAASQCLPKYFASLGLSKEQISARVEKAGHELVQSFMAIERGPGERPERFVKISKPVNETLINQYPSLACRYETFLFNEKRQDCWFIK